MENAVKFFIIVGMPVSLFMTALMGGVINLIEEHNLFTHKQGQKFLLRIFCTMMSVAALYAIIGVR